jgi:hypothetical protein
MYDIKLFIVRGSSNPKIGHVKYYNCCFLLEVEDYLETRSNLCNIHNVCYPHTGGVAATFIDLCESGRCGNNVSSISIHPVRRQGLEP